MLQFYNTLSKKKEIFKPIQNKRVGMYNCGPTVYDYAHLGNLRAFVFVDILRRTLEWNGYTVKQVMNITDVGHLVTDTDEGEDKMTKGLKREGKPVTLEAMHELADTYIQAFKNDLSLLNIETPTELPRASDHIAEQINLIKTLADKGFTYTTDDGVYFDTTKAKKYGAFGDLTKQETARIERNTQKKNYRDFALWKYSDALGWDSPWGMGFPGWHIECSAMSMKYLGETFDIHTGGIEHIPIHHTNEIAQSESATGKPLAHYWLHNEHLLVNGGKMAKAEGTGITLQDLIDKGYDPLSYRYLLLGSHYRTPANFTWQALDAASTALKKLHDRIAELDGHDKPHEIYVQKFTTAINDDLNTPEGLAVLWNLLKDSDVSDAQKKATALACDTVFGLNLQKAKTIEIPRAVQKLVDEREVARKEDDWQAADTLREKIKKLGYNVRDTDEGPKVKKI